MYLQLCSHCKHSLQKEGTQLQTTKVEIEKRITKHVGDTLSVIVSCNYSYNRWCEGQGTLGNADLAGTTYKG